MRKNARACVLLICLMSWTFLCAKEDNPSVRLHKFDLGFGYTFQSNIFQEFGDDSPEFTANTIGDLEVEFHLPSGFSFIPRLAVGCNQNHNYPAAGFPYLLAGMEIEHSRHELTLEGRKETDRLLYISQEFGKIIYDKRVFNATYKFRLTDRLTLRVEYEWENEKYMKDVAKRDMDSHGSGLQIYIRISPNFSPFAGGGWIGERAREINYSLNKSELWAGLSAKLPYNIQLYTRYKLSLRNYITDVIKDWNFGREDTHHSFIAELKIPLHRHFMIILKDYFKKGISTRLVRNFSDNQFSIMTVITF